MADTVRFSETLAGRLAGQDVRFLLTVVTPDIAALVVDPDHRSPAWGCVLADWLSPAPLSVVDGRLDLFVDVSGDRRVVEMRYRLVLRAVDGRGYTLLGTKTLRRRWWIWTFPWDATTLATRLVDEQGALVAEGVLRQGIVGVLAQGATFRASSVRAWAGFMRYYIATVLGVYLRTSGSRVHPGP